MSMATSASADLILLCGRHTYRQTQTETLSQLHSTLVT